MSGRDWTATAKEAAACAPPKKAQCKNAANWGLVRFLRAVSTDVQGKGQESWSMALRRAAKGLAEVAFAVSSAEQAVREVNGVGPATSGLLNTFWATCPPPSPSGQEEAAAAPAQKRAAGKRKSAGGDPQETAGATGRKRWVPKYKTANWALLVTLDRLRRQGHATVSKAQLVDEAEASQLSAHGIKPKAASTSAAAALGAGAYTYDGWSGVQKYLVQVLQGHSAPLCHTFGNPLQIRLTEEGSVFATELHQGAEARGDCRCGLVAATGSGAGPVDKGASRRLPPAADHDCIVIESSDEDDQPIAAAPAAKRARTDAAPATTAAAAAAPASGCGWKPLPQWRLSALSGDDDHDLRLPPLPAGVPFAQEYDVILLVDNREQFAHGATGGRSEGFEEGMRRLTQRGIAAEPRGLPIGDALWVARLRRAPHSEWCLDMVIERKRVDDLESSIKDSRYKKQKYFLKRCGLRRPCYLLEGDPCGAGAGSSSGEWRSKAVKTAMLTTEVIDGFQVLRTDDAHGTFDLYGRLTAALRALYAVRTGRGQGGAARGPGTVEAAAAADCPSYQAFAAAVAAAKHESKTVRALWGHQLTCIPGVGGEVAEAVLWEHPTPSSLMQAYARAGGREGGRALLTSLKTGAVRSVGPVLSARIYDWVTQAGGGVV